MAELYTGQAADRANADLDWLARRIAVVETMAAAVQNAVRMIGSTARVEGNLVVTGAATVTGTLETVGTAGIGTAPLARQALRVGGSISATSGQAIGVAVVTTLIAGANGDTLRALSLNPSFTPGSFTGLIARGLIVAGFSTATFTSPADPAGIEVAAVVGTGR